MKFPFPLLLAPMVGLTHVILRRIMFVYMPQGSHTLWPTEMLNSRKIPNENVGFTPETMIHEFEENLVPQILGNDKNSIQQTVLKLNQDWNQQAHRQIMTGIDINMGCPVQKALRHNYGVSLMGDVNYAAQVVQHAVEVSAVPVSVKLRAVGAEEKSFQELVHFVEHLEKAGASWITLHPRTAAQKRKGQADWDQITYLKKNISIPVVGNGDVQNYQDVLMMLEQTGCDAVMSGRGLAARPWMMWQIGHHLKLNEPLVNNLGNRQVPYSAEEEAQEYGVVLLRFIDLAEEYFMNKLGLSFNYTHRKILFYVKTTHVWLEFGHTLMAAVDKSKSIDELRERVMKFFTLEHRMMATTELRQ